MLGRVQELLVLATAALYSSGYAAIGLVLLLGSIITEVLVSRRLPWRRSGLDLYLLAFVSVLVVSGLFSSYQFVATGSALLAALTIYVAYGTSYRIVKRQPAFTQRILWFWYAGGIAAAALAIILFAIDGEPQAALPALGPNALGSMLLMAFVIGIGLLPTARPAIRYAVGAGEAVIAIALAFTLSRGAWIGAGCGLLALVGLSWRRWRVSESGHRVWPIVLAVVALTVTFALLGGQAAVLRKKALSITNLFKNRERLFLARSALAIAADHPLIGSGFNTFVLIHPHPSLRGDPLALKRRARTQSFAHNIFLNMAAEGGLLGLVAFVSLLVRGAAAGWRWHAAAAGRDRGTSATVLAAFVGLLVHQQFDGTMLSVHLSVGLWLLLAMMLAHESAPNPSAASGSGSDARPATAPHTVTGQRPVVLAVDPGREKCGLAVMDGRVVLARRVVPTAALAHTAGHLARELRVNTVALGDRTGREQARALLEAALPGVPVILVPEAGSTEAARQRYFAEHPPRGWRRLLPLSMLVPPEPYDDYVAVLLAERFLAANPPPGGAPPNGISRSPGQEE